MPPKLTGTGRLKAFAQPAASFKAVGQTDVDGVELAEGEFIALAAVFGNVDSYRERIVEGAFTETLAKWAASGDPIPVIWSHAWGDPMLHIGEVVWAKETPEGLLYKGRLDVADNPIAAQVYRLMKGRRIKQQSIGFDVLDAGEVIEDGDWIFEIRKMDLYEVGPCLVGVNQATELVDIKSTPNASGTPPLPEPEPSGQVTDPAATDVIEPSAAPGSTPDYDLLASKGLSPASVRLHLELLELGEDPETER